MQNSDLGRSPAPAEPKRPSLNDYDRLEKRCDTLEKALRRLLGQDSSDNKQTMGSNLEQNFASQRPPTFRHNYPTPRQDGSLQRYAPRQTSNLPLSQERQYDPPRHEYRARQDYALDGLYGTSQEFAQRFPALELYDRNTGSQEEYWGWRRHEHDRKDDADQVSVLIQQDRPSDQVRDMPVRAASPPPPPPPPPPNLPPPPQPQPNSSDVPALPSSNKLSNKQDALNTGNQEDVAKTSENEPGEIVPSQDTSRVTIIANKWDREHMTWNVITIPVDTSTAIPKQAVILRRQMTPDNDNKVQSETFEIYSPELKRILTSKNNWFNDTNTEADQPLLSPSPFYEFIWHWENHEESCKEQRDDTDDTRHAREDLKAVLRLIKTSPLMQSYFRSRDAIKKSKKIRFEWLWTLFPHGAKVYARSYLGKFQMFEVKTCGAPPYSEQFDVTCTAFDWDGTRFSTYHYDFYIREFLAEKPINSLDVFPTEYWCDSKGEYDDKEIRTDLLKRGRHYVDLCTRDENIFQYQYQGPALVTPTGPRVGIPNATNSSYGSTDSRQYIQSGQESDVMTIDIEGTQNQIIVDNYSFMKSDRNTSRCSDMPPLGRKVPFLESDCVCPLHGASTTHRWREAVRTPSSIHEIGNLFAEDDDRLCCLPPRLLGFALKDKIWAQFSVDLIEPMPPIASESRDTSNDTKTIVNGDRKEEKRDPEGPFWQELVLEQKSKKLLMAFVQHHKAPSSKDKDSKGTNAKSYDVIEGKGKGLVILLHGPPGVGKTLTAETIAIQTQRPLLSVSVAEIGVRFREAEKNLNDVFVDAARWGAVLLMDEADVFVEERIKADLERNALVSVLLRSLEYYEGIIILTTNRVRSIDAAIQSRIQLAIQYRSLAPDQRLAIYRNRLKRVPDEEIKDRKRLDEQLSEEGCPLLEKRVNGRHIRNIVTYARALAKSEGPGQKLEYKHLVEVDRMNHGFMEGMKDVLQRQGGKNEMDFDVRSWS